MLLTKRLCRFVAYLLKYFYMKRKIALYHVIPNFMLVTFAKLKFDDCRVNRLHIYITKLQQ